MIKGILNKFFAKDETIDVSLPIEEKGSMKLTLDSTTVGVLTCEDGKWKFVYSEEFKKQKDYHKLIGFPDLNEEYESEELWPFFRIRIPGLKQPAIQEIVEKENIENNEYELLKRFGRKSISNPYELSA